MPLWTVRKRRLSYLTNLCLSSSAAHSLVAILTELCWPFLRLKDIEMAFREVGCENAGWIWLTEDGLSVRWQASVCLVVNLELP